MFEGECIDVQITSAMEAQSWDDARALIQQTLAAMPPDWKPACVDGDCVRCAFWNHNELLSYVGCHKASRRKAVVWTSPSYSKLWWQLAVANVKQGRLDNAAVCVDCGIAIEPDHPLLWIERGYIFGRQGRPADALQAYRTAATVRPWTPPAVLARALRGEGLALLDLGQLEQAREAYARSLKLEPENPIAIRELQYIGRALDELNARSRPLPWFEHCMHYPPTDSLTIQLRALVEGLPSIPGPQTVGPENYSRSSRPFWIVVGRDSKRRSMPRFRATMLITLT